MRGAFRAHEGPSGGCRGDEARRARRLSPAPAVLTARAFWFLRHGETDWNAQGLAQGNVDIPLNSAGLDQARAATLLLRDRNIATIVSSPLSRARDTAQIVAETLLLPIEIDEGLREVAFGAGEGKPMTQWFDDWVDGIETPAGAESFVALGARAVAAVNRALTLPAPALIVAHGGLFRALRAAMGLPPNVRTANGVPFFCTPGRSAWTLTPAGTESPVAGDRR